MVSSLEHPDSGLSRSPRYQPNAGTTRLSEEQQAAIDELTTPPKYKNESKLHIFAKLPWHDKPAYFRTHFLVPVIGAVAVIALITVLVVKFFFPSPRPALYVAVLDDAMPLKSAQTLQSDYGKAIDKNVTIDNYFHMNDDGLSKLQTMISNKQIDVVIAPERVFKELAGYGYFSELSAVLPQDQQHSFDQYAASFPGYSDSDEYDAPDQSGVGKGDTVPYGLELSDAVRWKSLADESATAANKDANSAVLAGVVANAPDSAAATKFISYLYS